MTKFLFNVWVIDYNPNKFNFSIPVLNTEMEAIATSEEEARLKLKKSVEIHCTNRVKVIDCCNLMFQQSI